MPDTRNSLAVFGFDVRAAGEAEQLRALMRDLLPDAIVLDLQLPRTDGWQLTREIKANPKTRHIVVIVVSACVMPAEREAAQEAGCDAFIAKPCDPMDIVSSCGASRRRRQSNVSGRPLRSLRARTRGDDQVDEIGGAHGVQRRLGQIAQLDDRGRC